MICDSGSELRCGRGRRRKKKRQDNIWDEQKIGKLVFGRDVDRYTEITMIFRRTHKLALESENK